MSPKRPAPRGLLKDTVKRTKKVFKPRAQTPIPSAPSPLPQTSSASSSSQIAPAHEQLAQAPDQTEQSLISPQPPLGASEPTSTALPASADNIRLANIDSGLSQAVKKAGADSWLKLKKTVQALEKSEIFSPLKPAVAGFLEVVDMFEMAAQNRNDYAELASNLQGMINEFKEHPGEHTSSKLSEALETMATGLQREIEYVLEQQQRSGARRHLGAAQDLDDVQGCHRRVETLCRELQNKALVKIWKMMEEQQGILEEQRVIAEDARIEKLDAALKAMYDSSFADVIGRRTCTPGTREAILEGMREWVDDPYGPKIYWLNGMAGTGKTTLAYSFCADMQLASRLGASFFCSRADADSQNVSRVVPTIAHQLARLLPAYREALIREIGQNIDICARKIDTQFEKLIRDPLRRVKSSVANGIVIVIDALDECGARDGAQSVLDVLFRHARDLPIKFLITCRPEPGLFDVLESKDRHYRSVLHLHDIEASFVQADIKTYLDAELAATSLPQEKIEQLAEQAGTLFIYAATAVRYIHPKSRKVNFHRRLDDVLSIASKSKSNKHKGIDDLYLAIVTAPFADDDLDDREKENVRLVLDTAVCARVPMSVSTMTGLLGLDDEQDIILALQHLRSVLHVSQEEGLISTFHASFPDFMLSRERSRDRCCNTAEHHRQLALGCFSTMQRLLRFNICNLESSFVFDKDIPDREKKIDAAVSPELFYACLYWGDHLRLVGASDDACSALGEFLSNQLLFWMEVMNLKHCIGIGADILHRAHSWLQDSKGPEDTLELAVDASRFVMVFGMSPASRSTPHIYISALPFWPETRAVRIRYQQYTRELIRLEGSAMRRRDPSSLATWNATSDVFCVAFSHDSTRIASGSQDGTICIWDARSGDAVARPLEGHIASVFSVAFSHDSTRIVSGSQDHTIRVWDARSGDAVTGPFRGHTGSVFSVAFSHDSTRIVSGSQDCTIRIWDARSGDAVARPLEGHTNSVFSVAFSHDSTRIVSGSRDRTIRVWDVRRGDAVALQFEGHTDSVPSVAFSHDSTRIVSSSLDRTIRVWDARSGDAVAGPFRGHTGWVNSVAFSHDSTRIVSGSQDHTIRVWDARSGDAVTGPFRGHTGSVFSVAFSHDSTRIVSGSEDCTIRVWDARSGDPVAGPFKGHAEPVNSVAFSHDSTRIVSGSYDRTIRVWDARSREAVAGPFQGHTSSVYSVAFSHDSTRIISGSHDRTIRVWDARSGEAVAGPSQGHAGPVNSVAFSQDSTRIVSGSEDCTIRVWDACSGDAVAGPFEGHFSSVNSVAFSHDSTRIVSGSHDGTIRVWDVSTPDALDSRLFRGWTIDEEGFVTGQQGQLLLCVPADLHIGLLTPTSMLCIYNKGSLGLNFDGVSLGRDWVRCYRC